MASLVANYGSDDDSDQISDESDQNEQLTHNYNHPSVQPGEVAEGSSRNYLMQGDADSDSEEDSSDDEDQPKEKLPSPQVAKMKVPGIGKKKKKKKDIDKEKPKPAFKSNASGSVWLNPYEKAEMKKQSVLEKHVKMTEVHIATGKKARTCKMFKLTGHCRFGKGCKYSHDVETLTSSQQGKPEQVGPKEGTSVKRVPELPPPPKPRGFMGTYNSLNSNSKPGHGKYQQRKFEQQERFMTNQGEEDDDKFLGDKKRKIRVGVSQSLVPPKRALMALGKQRAEERPWTMDN